MTSPCLESGGIYSSIEAYNLDDDTWKTLQTTMPTARASFAAVSTGRKVLVIGGIDVDSPLNIVEMLDVDSWTWSTLPSMKTKRDGCASGVLGDFVIVVGGHDDNNEDLATAELYNLLTQEWTDLPDMSCARVGCAMVVIGMKAYVFGGNGQSTAEVFDFETQTWTTLPSMSKIGCGMTAVTVGKFILVIGGFSRVVEVFDIESQTWSFLQQLPDTLRFGCTAGLVGNQVLVVGGVGLDIEKLLGLAFAGEEPEEEGMILKSGVSLDVGFMMSLVTPQVPESPTILGRRERKAALEKWVDQVKKMKQDFLGQVETKTVQLNAEYAMRKKSLDRAHEELEKWYRERLEKVEHVSGTWTDEVDDKLDDAEDQIEELKKRIAGQAKSGGRHKKPDLSSLIRCPITNNIMVHPVMAADGQTYERSEIEKMFAEIPRNRPVKSPVTGEMLAHRILVPNTAVEAMAAMAAEYREE